MTEDFDLGKDELVFRRWLGGRSGISYSVHLCPQEASDLDGYSSRDYHLSADGASPPSVVVIFSDAGYTGFGIPKKKNQESPFLFGIEPAELDIRGIIKVCEAIFSGAARVTWPILFCEFRCLEIDRGSYYDLISVQRIHGVRPRRRLSFLRAEQHLPYRSETKNAMR